MITPEMTPAQIRKEVKKDMPHVLHALMKSYGGKRKYEADEQNMADRLARQPEGSIELGNVEAYTSGQTGNNWIIYSYAKNIGFNTVTTGHREFVWFDTPEGSIAAIQFSEVACNSFWAPTIYSGHFFQRYAEREHLGPVDLQIVIDFMRQNTDSIFQADAAPSSPGKYRFDIILRNGIGRGYTRDFYPDNPAAEKMFISYVRTYLPTDLLSAPQRQQTAEARAMQASKSRPADTFVSMFLKRDEKGMEEYFANLFKTRGLSSKMGVSFLHLLSDIVAYEIMIIDTPSEERTPSKLRSLLLQSYHRYEQNVFDYIIDNPSSDGRYSMLDVLTVAKITNHDIDIRAMMTAMMNPDPDDKHLIYYIAKASSKFEARFQECVANGEFKKKQSIIININK